MAVPKSNKTVGDPSGDQIAYGMDAFIVDMATDPLLNTLKLEDLKPDICQLLAGMLLGWVARARSLHQDIQAAVKAEAAKGSARERP